MLDPNFHPFPELHTERLVLRRMEPEDDADIFFLRSDEQVLTFIHKEPVETLKEACDFIRFIHEATDANHTIMWGIALQEDPSRLIGTICLWNIRRADYRAEVGYALHPDYWKKGLMKEALMKVMGYGFNTLRLHSIDALIDPRNTASAHILKAAGFVQEGWLKENTCFRGKFFDTVIYSKLRNA